MNKFFITALAAAVVTAATAAPLDRVTSDRPFRFAPKALAEQKASTSSASKLRAKDAAKVRFASENEFAITNLPAADDTGYLDGPKGKTWYYNLNYIKTDNAITGYTVDVYNEALTLEGSFTDNITLEEGETRVAAVQVGSLVSQKFFNYDNSYELMVDVILNTTEYVNHYRTLVYSLNNNTPVANIPGYYVSAVNTATDDYSEKFWITFMTEEETETPEINGVINSMDYVFKTYKSASLSGFGDPVLTSRVPSITLAGENAVPFISTQANGQPYFAVARMKYCWFLDPYDFQNETPTPDNSLLIDVYTTPSSWSNEVTHYSTTTIPSEATEDNKVFYYLGRFSYNNDLSMGVYSDDGTPGLIITEENYRTASDDYIYNFGVYTGAQKDSEANATKLFDLATGVEGGYILDDIKGQAPQVMFLRKVLDSYVFDFVNLLTGEKEHSLPYMLGENVYITTSTQRVAFGDSYLYVAPQNQGTSADNGDTLTSYVYINPDGTINHTDYVNLGQNVDYAILYAASGAFDPFIFNIDANREYMALVKRRDNPNVTGNHEELIVTAAGNETFNPILQLGPDDNFGTLASVFLANTDNDNKSLVVVYNKNYSYTTRSFALPLESFTQGDGSLENPYQITSVGGLAQIKAKPAAHYVIAADFDAAGATLDNSNYTFTGSLDGQNHTIRNLNIEGRAIFPVIQGASDASDESAQGRVANLNLVKPVFNATVDGQGIIAGTVNNASISNIHISKAKVTCEDGDVAGLVGSASLYSQISECSVNGDITASGAAAGIALSTRTSAAVSACAFSGSITGESEIGGIVSSMSNNAAGISDCHVNADLTGKNTIGGICGSSDRPLITRCHVQGTITATEAPRWGGGPKAGGIVGSLTAFSGNSYNEDGDEATVTPTPVVSNCYVNLSSLEFTGENGQETYTGQNDTMHRIVGYSTINAEPEIVDIDENWEPIYGDPYGADPGLANNYATAMLPAVDSSEEMDGLTTTEGLSVNPFNLDHDFFTAMGFNYGYDAENPWDMTGDATAPKLYFEKESHILLVNPAEGTVNVGDEITITLSLEDEEITEDMFGNFSFESSDMNEQYLQYVDMGAADGTIFFKYKGVAPGEVTFTFKLAGAEATSVITVKQSSAIGEVDSDKVALSYRGGIAQAQGCVLRVYNAQGALVLTANGTADLRTLAAGIYVVTATDAEGRTATLKARN